MDIEYENKLNIALSNDEIDIFQSILEKLTTESIGFSINILTDEEKEFLVTIKNNL